MFLEQFPEEGKSHGWLEVVCGSMFSGKTEELIRRLRRAEFANQSFLLFKPKLDNRYSDDLIISHAGDQFDAINIENPAQILTYWTEQKVVAIDEVQFFDTTILDVVSELASKGVRVICAGLDMDYKGIPFGPVPYLMAAAEYITKVHAICVSCGNLAQFSHRTVKVDSQVLLGAVEKYKPLCRNCYNKIEH